MGNCAAAPRRKMESPPQDLEPNSPPRPETPPPNQHVDRYGFVRKKDAFDPHESEPPKVREQRSKKEKERVEKWKVMLSSSLNPYRIVRSRQFQRRIRKGIPESMRGEVWIHLLMDVTDQDKAWARGLFATAASQLAGSDAGRDAMDAIRKDLGRTYPGHIQFQAEEGQAALETVLRGYAAFDLEVGYCQGMSFITALLLMYMDEAEALCVLKKLMNKSPWMMRDLFKPGMPAVAMRMYQYDVILGRAARKVSKHFKHLKFETSMYATHWFATIFTYNFPFFLVLRIWDVFLVQGWPIVIGAAVAFWRMHTKIICNVTSFELLFEKLKKILAELPLASADPLITDASYIASKFSTEDQLKGLERDYFKLRHDRAPTPGNRG